MIEITILNYLNGCLSVPVYMEVPERPPARYVVLEKTGSSKRNFIYEATFAIQSIADSLYEAAELNEEVKVVMEDLPELDQVSRSTLNSDYNFTDTTTKKYRYQAVFDLVHF